MDSNVIKSLQAFSKIAAHPYLYNSMEEAQKKEEVAVKLIAVGHSKDKVTELLKKCSLNYLYDLYNRTVSVRNGPDISESLKRLAKKSSIDQWQKIKNRRKLFMNR